MQPIHLNVVPKKALNQWIELVDILEKRSMKIS